MLYRSAELIYKEFEKRGCSPKLLATNSSMMVFTSPRSNKRHIIKGVVSPCTSALASSACNDKWITNLIAEELRIKTPATFKRNKRDTVDSSILKKWKKVVVKPAYMTAHGDGITTDIESEDDLKKAIYAAHEWSQDVLVQEQVAGEDIRVLMIGGKVVAATTRKPASIMGDGQSTVSQLISKENNRRKLILDHPDPCFIFLIDPNKVEAFLGSKQMDSIPEKGQSVQVMGTSNVGSGGTSINITDKLPDNVRHAAETLAEAVGLTVGGIDFLINESGQAWLIEMNIAPALVLHEFPHVGEPVPVTELYVDFLLNGTVDWNKS